jgi:hypothetical protein
MTERVRFFEGKKFLWNGEEYDDKGKADTVKKQYSKSGFDVQSCSENGKVILYTRRVVTEVVLE